MWDLADAARIDVRLDSRAVTFENPGGERGAGGQREGGRKGRPAKFIQPGERVVLADIAGPGIARHLWMTIRPAAPADMRAALLEAFYDGAPGPSISVPAFDFFGCPHGRPVAYASALTAVQEGRGFNAYFPMPFRERLRLEIENRGPQPLLLYYQLDYTLMPALEADAGYLHVSFRRQNPTRMREDFVIAEGLRGPGRFLGCVVGVRVLDEGSWYGEGEVKVYRDGDATYPTICGTGLEDYVGSAWGMGPHHAIYAGAPLEVRRGEGPQPDFVGFYRWHLPDPIVFERDLRVTIQQIGYALFREGEEAAFERYRASHPAAGRGWASDPAAGIIGQGIVERIDDYCAAAFVYCREPQPVHRADMVAALEDLD